MKYIVFALFFGTLLGCSGESSPSTNDTIKIRPIEELKNVDGMISSIKEKPQKYIASSTEPSTITGNKGTIIHLNPEDLETIDGSKLGSDIEVELMELHDNSSLILNNSPTTSNGKILVTGGAYYINMKSDGKQLQLKQNTGLDVEFPKITKGEMALFLGERDSLDQVNWIQTNDKFVSKNLSTPEEPEKKTKYIKKTSNELDAIFGYIDGEDSIVETNEEEVSKEEYEQYLKKKEEIETCIKTYEATKVLNFGWINCDRFYNDPREQFPIQLTVNNPDIRSARFYLVFNNINSMMQSSYFNIQKEAVRFENIPENEEVTILAISASGDKPMLYKKKITTGRVNKLEVAFEETTINELKSALNELN